CRQGPDRRRLVLVVVLGAGRGAGAGAGGGILGLELWRRRFDQPGPGASQLPADAMSATRRHQQSALANPVLVGAMTVLVIMVAVFLAYNANQGLPFVPTRELKVDIASGSDLVPGNEVREGGFRIGLVSAMKPIELSDGQIGAQMTLK